jgi:hypothetical protein
MSYRLDKQRLKQLKVKALYSVRINDTNCRYAFDAFNKSETPSMLFHTANGESVLIAHGRADGIVAVCTATALKADIFISCFPRSVIALHPGLRDHYPLALRMIDCALRVTVYWGWLFVQYPDDLVGV